MKRVLFVCTGNTCRSPMAEALLKHKMADIEVQSAGLFAFEGAPASEYTVQALREKGILCNHKSKQVNEKLLDWADLVLTMTVQHKESLHKQYPDYKHKVHALKQFVDDQENVVDVQDPFGGSLETYRNTLEELEIFLDKLIKKIEIEEE